MKSYSFMTTNDTNQIYIYDDINGTYSREGESIIKKRAEILRPYNSTHQVNEIVNKIKRRTYVNRSSFDGDPNILNLKNGLLDIQTGKFSQHSSSYPSLVQLSVNYEPDAQCPNFLKFLARVFHPQDVFLAMQIIGYCLYRSCKYEKAILLLGKGSNGKGSSSKQLKLGRS